MDIIAKLLQNLKIGGITTVYEFICYRQGRNSWVVGRGTVSVKTPGVDLEAAVRLVYDK